VRQFPTKLPKIPQVASTERATTDRVAAALGIDPAEVRQAILLARSGRVDLLDRVLAGHLDLRRALQVARVRGGSPS
jgi:hypothetical protein